METTLTPAPSLPLREPTQFDSGVKVSEDYRFLFLNVTRRKVIVRHPGYPPQDDRLFSLYAWDSASNQGGLHYGLAHNVCAIIADNRLDGYLSTTHEGGMGHRITMNPDEVLPAGDYWFFVPPPQTSPGV
jgi:hypothetical protein